MFQKGSFNFKIQQFINYTKDKNKIGEMFMYKKKETAYISLKESKIGFSSTLYYILYTLYSISPYIIRENIESVTRKKNICNNAFYLP